MSKSFTTISRYHFNIKTRPSPPPPPPPKTKNSFPASAELFEDKTYVFAFCTTGIETCWLMGFPLIQGRQEHCNFTKTILLPLMTWREQRPKYQKPSYCHNLSGISRGSHARDQLTHWSLGDVGVLFKVIPRTGSLSMFCEIALLYSNATEPRWCSSTLVHAMAWCHQSTGLYLRQCWLRAMSPYGVTRPQIIFPHQGG